MRDLTPGDSEIFRNYMKAFLSKSPLSSLLKPHHWDFRRLCQFIINHPRGEKKSLQKSISKISILSSSEPRDGKCFLITQKIIFFISTKPKHKYKMKEWINLK